MSSNPNTAEETLYNLIPKTLDDIFRTNKDKGELRIATDEELERISAHVSDSYVRHTLTHWQLIAIHIHIGEKSTISLRLTGRIQETGRFWITSHVLGIDRERGLIKTANSTYRVRGDKATEEELDLMSICAALNTWGIGQFFGAPEFFF